MQIKRLILNNFRSYLGKHELEFSTRKDQNVTLIHGVNGAGKTSLFIALNWVLFGNDFPYSGHLVSNQLCEGDPWIEAATASVALSFEHLGRDYYISREARAEPLASGERTEREAAMELWVFDETGQSKREKYAETFLKSLIPNAIRTFFFFDGDKISEFTKAGTERDKDITKAVNDVLQLELVERSGRHLGSIVREINRDIAKRGSPKSRELQTRRESIETDIHGASSELKHLKDEREAASQHLSEIDTSLRDLSVVAEKSKRRELLEKGLKTAKIDVQSVKASLMKGCVDYFPTAVLSQLTSASRFLDTKRRRREIPGSYKEQFLRDLLTMNKCICERPLEAGTVEREHIQALLDVVLPSGVQDEALVLNAAIRRILMSQEHSFSLLRNLEESLHAAQQNVNDIENEVKMIASEIAEIQVSEVTQLEQDRAKTLKSMQDLGVKIGSLTDALDRAEKDLIATRREFEVETAKEDKSAELSRLSLLADESASAFVRIKRQLIADLRSDMSEEATRIFKGFTWKKDYFDRIEVGDDYLIKMLNAQALDVRAGMSMGETQLLSLAFMLSMTTISEYEAPLVIDTPLARLSKEVRQNLLLALPLLTKQLILLCTDTEMDDIARGALGATVGAEFHLIFANGSSEIKTGALV